jgi:phenylpropionate dioxygenase-like ring-hydroxylating dioxygenase large terminal subunit
MYPFNEGSFAPLNCWYVAAFCDEIKGELLDRWICNKPFVMYRAQSGKVVALDGRCPHRHFPLGKSKLIGDEVECLYHGLRFNTEGACTKIPSQVHIPSSCHIKSYPVKEHGMWVFIWPGDPDLADVSLLPNLEDTGFTDKSFGCRPFFQVEIEGRYQLMNDNLLDLTHLAYLHANSIGNEGNASAPEEKEERENFMRSRRYLKNVPIMPAQQDAWDYKGMVNRLAGMDYYLPGFHAGLDVITIPEDHPERGGEELMNFRVFHAVTPGKLDTTNYFFGFGGRNIPEEEFERTKQFLWPVIEEDAMATKEIEIMLKSLDFDPRDIVLGSDSGSARGRQLLQKMMDDELR